jgi:mono/diheme cytochrome c family protein
MEVGLMISKLYDKRRWLIIPIIGLLWSMMGYLAGCATNDRQTTLKGESIFAANCSACHTIDGGNLAGPDLMGVTQQRSQQWLVDFISNPEQAIISGDPSAQGLLKEFNNLIMPNMGLTSAEIQAVITYIDDKSRLISSPPSADISAALPPGNAENGKALFLGLVHLENGAPFCGGCHSLNSAGILGGGTLGPNLTNAYNKYGDAGLGAIISNEPFLSMRPQYMNNPITAQETADLIAFIKSEGGQPEINRDPIVIGISLVGFLVIIIAMAFVWRGRLRSVRKQLVEDSRSRK